MKRNSIVICGYWRGEPRPIYQTTWVQFSSIQLSLCSAFIHRCWTHSLTSQFSSVLYKIEFQALVFKKGLYYLLGKIRILGATRATSNWTWILCLYCSTASSVIPCSKDGDLVKIDLSTGDGTSQLVTRYRGDSYYGDNQHCEWLVDAGSDQGRVMVTVLENDLHWAPETAICPGYDYVEVRDG